MHKHTVLVEEILIHLGQNASELGRFWKQATGAARSFDNPDRVISFGIVGGADITGILLNGKRVEIECKTGNATQSKEQKNFEKMINKFGGLYFVAKSKEAALDFIRQVTSQ